MQLLCVLSTALICLYLSHNFISSHPGSSFRLSSSVSGRQETCLRKALCLQAALKKLLKMLTEAYRILLIILMATCRKVSFLKWCYRHLKLGQSSESYLFCCWCKTTEKSVCSSLNVGLTQKEQMSEANIKQCLVQAERRRCYWSQQ